MRVILEIEIDPNNIDYILFAWFDEISDKSREQGKITKFEVQGFPATLDLNK